MAPVPDRGAFSLSMADVPDSPEYEKLKTFEKQIRWMSPDLKPRNNSLDGPSELPDLELAFPKASTLGFATLALVTFFGLATSKSCSLDKQATPCFSDH